MSDAPESISHTGNEGGGGGTVSGYSEGQISGAYTYRNGAWVLTSSIASPQTTAAAQSTAAPALQVGNGVTVTPTSPTTASTTQIGVTDLGGQLVTDPGALLNDEMKLSNNVPKITDTEVSAGMQGNEPAQGDPTALNQTAAQTGPAAQATVPTKTDAAGVTTATAADKIDTVAGTAAQGTMDPRGQVDANGLQIDTAATAAGTNDLGKALNTSAQQNISNIVDTTTLAGKLLAEQLGEGNYTDSKATLKGQLDILASEFVDPATGDPKIPSWAQGTARNVSRIASFSGMTGTAATAAMAQAIMEASIPIAQQDAQFFQTLTVKNLDNRQQATINKANVLANLELANLDARTTAAVTNAQSFMQLNLKNLDNAQQMQVINTQARQQALLEDTKAENTNRLFVAQSQNEKDMFYSNLEASISQFNADQNNSMSKFNTGEANDMKEFNAGLENNREQFYKNMQYQIDTANAKWRQTVTLTENAQKFEAAATDVKNLVGISVEQLNQLWDRSDALLDYAFKSTENAKDRASAIALAQIQSSTAITAADAQGSGSFWGSILGAVVGAVF